MLLLAETIFFNVYETRAADPVSVIWCLGGVSAMQKAVMREREWCCTFLKEMHVQLLLNADFYIFLKLNFYILCISLVLLSGC